MNEKIEDPFGMTSMVNTWMKSVGDLWGNLSDQWAADQNRQQPEAEADSGTKAQAAMEAAMKNWQTMAGAMATPESMTALLKGGGAMPEVLLKLAQSTMGSFMEMQESMIQRVGRMGESVKAYQFQDIDENLFRAWSDVYEKEFQRFFQIPQLGLLRTYQEKANRVSDKFNVLQSTLSEFISMLGLPFNRSIRVMHEKVSQMAEKGELPEDTKDYYNMWIRVLEGHFMTLYQTPEYVETLARTINALADFTAARDAAWEDLLSQLPVAKKTDMDDLAREIYELKKRLRRLEAAQE